MITNVKKVILSVSYNTEHEYMEMVMNNGTVIS